MAVDLTAGQPPIAGGDAAALGDGGAGESVGAAVGGALVGLWPGRDVGNVVAVTLAAGLSRRADVGGGGASTRPVETIQPAVSSAKVSMKLPNSIAADFAVLDRGCSSASVGGAGSTGSIRTLLATSCVEHRRPRTRATPTYAFAGQWHFCTVWSGSDA